MSEKFDAALAKAKENLRKLNIHGDCDKRIGELEAEAARYYELSRALEQTLTDKEDLLASARKTLGIIARPRCAYPDANGACGRCSTCLARKWLGENEK